MKKVGSEERTYTTARMRCSKKQCHVTVSILENTIWADVADRTLFIFVVVGFINR